MRSRRTQGARMRYVMFAVLPISFVIGCTGPLGPMGEPGTKGDKGDKGTMGDKGDKGDMGTPGGTGAQGNPGTVGAAGLACWDLNKNGVCDKTNDASNEDIDHSGDCDTF